MNVRQVIPRDAIPSVDDPEFGTRYDGDPGDDVIVVEGDRARAYPIRFLHYHEIVNDTVDGTPVAVTWCPLCGSAIVYDRRVEDQTLEFGVSGKLADDDLVMYDRETESEWKQSLGEAIGGPLEATALDVIPAPMTTYEAFRDDYPDGVVLQPPDLESEAASDTDEPAPVDYDAEPYQRYFQSDGFGLAAHRDTGGREWNRDDIDPKTVVIGIEHQGTVLGFPLPRVEAAGGVATASVGDLDVVVFADERGFHAFEAPDFALDRTGGALVGDDATWNPVTGQSDDGRTLGRVPAKRVFAFAWQDDHGPERSTDLWTGRIVLTWS